MTADEKDRRIAQAAIQGFSESFAKIAGRPPTQEELNGFANRLNATTKEFQRNDWSEYMLEQVAYDERYDALEKKQAEQQAELDTIKPLAVRLGKKFIDNKEGYETAVDWLWRFVDIINDEHPRHGLVFARAQEAIGPCKTGQVRGRSWELLYELVFGESLGGAASDTERDIVISRVSVLLEQNSTMRLTLKHIAESQHLDECTSRRCNCHAGVARAVLERYRYMDGMAAQRKSNLEDLESEITRLKIEKESYYAQAEHYRPYLQSIAGHDHLGNCTMDPAHNYCGCPCYVASKALKEAP